MPSRVLCLIGWLRCLFAHRRGWHVIAFYSNRTHRWRCDRCGREWDD